MEVRKLMNSHEYEKLLLEAKQTFSAIAATIPPSSMESPRPIVLDGIFSSASNTLRNLAIYFAACRAGQCNQAFYLKAEDEVNHSL